MKHIIDTLKESGDKCFLKKETNLRSVSLAQTQQNRSYIGGKIESYNHLLDIPSELSASILASQSDDYRITDIVTMIFSNKREKCFVDPSVLKLLVDHSKRTGVSIKYSLVDEDGELIYSIDDVNKAFPFYISDVEILKKAATSRFENIMVSVDGYNKLGEKEISDLLQKYSRLGISKNFPTSNSATGYGAAVITSKGNLYYSGQYSTPDHRYGVHAEPAAFVAALSNNDREITYIGVSSTKHQDVPCEMCGCCRQFYSEIEERTGKKIKFFTFSGDGNIVNRYDSIEQYLPGQWSSKK